MRKKLTALALAAMTAALMTGCKNYEKVEVSGSAAQETGAALGGEDTAAYEAEQPADKAQPETSRNMVETTKETAPSMEERDETVYVNATDLNVRNQPRPGAEVVGRLNTGAELHRTGFTDSWSCVEYQGAVCYVASRYLTTEKPQPQETTAAASQPSGAVSLNPDWKYAGYAKITSGQAVLYRAEGENRKGKVVCVNAGHGTKGGSSVKTQCHPDGTPKVTGGTTGAGATSAVAVSSGMTFSDGTPEAKVTLALAKVLKDKLLARGYDVLMIRESDDVQLDNVARTVIANNMADCHIALHWDSTTSNKGAFYMSVPSAASYRAMEPVASHWQQHHALGDSLIAGLKGAGVKIFSNGKMEMDLTQTSYSTVPSIDIELGDKASDHSAATLDNLGQGLADGVEMFFQL
ncbi:MAG: N-acetylmuramoyl-L-alanine amidase [Eubacteriales bacterium]|nr:N-acetylmuramoyl-L-alanine amidase [Eubacteriales bacterium]